MVAQSRFFKVYLMPAAVLQSVIVGGGYGTGREVTEFISGAGPMGGLAAIALVFAIWAVLIALSFELARMAAAYDYRTFLKGIIGQGWLIYETLAIVTLLLVLAVVLSASSKLMQDTLGVAKGLSVAIIIGFVGFVAYAGRAWVEKLLSVWAIAVSLFLLTVFLLVWLNADSHALLQSGDALTGRNWVVGGATFAFYNIALVPILLYTITEIRTRSEAFLSGVIAAFAGILPAIVMHLTFVPSFPDVLDQALPLYSVVSELDLPGLSLVYFLVLQGTIVLTAVGALQGVIERLDAWLSSKSKPMLSAWQRGALASLTLVISAILSTFGVINLVASGYGTVAWGFLLIYVVPVLTLGLWRVIAHRN